MRKPTKSHPDEEKFMKKLLAAIALAASSIALAYPALADDPPAAPVTPGPHTLTEPGTKGFPVTAALDCGPACFSFGDKSARYEFHWAGDKWLEQGGMWTADGITFTNHNGFTATMS
jgi:hypothetical protein